MLRNYLTSLPYTKFIVIEDSIEERGKPIFDFLLTHHLGRTDSAVHYFIFQENVNRAKKNLENKNGIIFHDCFTNACTWSGDLKTESFMQILNRLGSRDIVFVDSLAHVIYQYGLTETYRIFNTVKTHTSVAQIICLLHLDLMEKHLQANKLFKHLCTLCMTMKPKFNNDNKRIKYLFKKAGGKIIRETEEYYFENDNLVTQKVEKIDVAKILQNGNTEVDPEALATFRISLNEDEKKARDELVLPYLPKLADQSSTGGNIFYEFDEQDDWDEEDPDDDLDI